MSQCKYTQRAPAQPCCRETVRNALGFSFGAGINFSCPTLSRLIVQITFNFDPLPHTASRSCTDGVKKHPFSWGNGGTFLRKVNSGRVWPTANGIPRLPFLLWYDYVFMIDLIIHVLHCCNQAFPRTYVGRSLNSSLDRGLSTFSQAPLLMPGRNSYRVNKKNLPCSTNEKCGRVVPFRRHVC